MRAEDLLKLMDLEDAAPDGDLVGKGESAEGQKPKKPPAETALRVDKWGMRRGAELAADEFMREAAGITAPVPEANRDGSREVTPEEAYWGHVMADMHAAAYDPTPERNESCTDQLRHDFVTQIMETPEFHEMRASTVLNPAAAELATGCFVKKFAARRAEAARDQAQGAKGKGGGAKGGKGLPPPDAEIQTMKAAAQAVAEASAAVEEMTDAADMCGLGGTGAGTGAMDAKRVAALHAKVKRSPNLQRIAKLAGRFRRVAASKQRQKVTHGADEVVGVTLGDEIAKLVPAELGKLAVGTDPTLALDTMRRLMERQTLCRETKASEPVGKGPIVITVDESGSMTGPKVETAKALALALAWIARKQNRWCALVSFSGGSKIEPGSWALLPPRRAKEIELITWLEHFYGGGTTMDVPLHEIPAWWPKFVAEGMTRGKTDIVMITDAEVDVPPDLEKSFNAFKAAEKVKLTTLVVQGRPGNIKCVSDEVHEVRAITTDDEAVGKILSV